jgi:hypothetical protein
MVVSARAVPLAKAPMLAASKAVAAILIDMSVLPVGSAYCDRRRAMTYRCSATAPHYFNSIDLLNTA